MSKAIDNTRLQITLLEIHAAIPRHLFEKSTLVAMQYVLRAVALAAALYYAATFLDVWIRLCPALLGYHQLAAIVKYAIWPTYWLFQSLTFAGFWCLSTFEALTGPQILTMKYLGHEAGHGTLSPYKWINHVVGFTLHTVSFNLHGIPR